MEVLRVHAAGIFAHVVKHERVGKRATDELIGEAMSADAAPIHVEEPMASTTELAEPTQAAVVIQVRTQLTEEGRGVSLELPS